MLASVVILAATYGLSSAHQADAWESLIIAIKGTAIGLGIFGLWHLIRAPWLIHHEKVSGEEKRRGWLAGAFGLIIVAGIVLGATWSAVALYHNRQTLLTANRTLTEENGTLKQENAKLKNVPPKIQTVTPALPRESPNSLRKRTLRLCAALDAFFDKRYEAWLQRPKVDDSASQQQMKDFFGETERLYQNDFKQQTLEIVSQLQQKGLDVGTIAAEYGAAKRAPMREEIAHLRDLAHYLDANDHVVHF